MPVDVSTQQNLVARLNRVEGQLGGIRRMIQEPRHCVDILQQIKAAQAALNRVSLSVFKFHVSTCVPQEIESGDLERVKSLSELTDIFDRFSGR
jgi:DNA-binding FrmR family transcriptional regulator